MPLKTSLYRKQACGRWPSRNSQRREVLSVNMISLPMADFRHITHIGNDAHADSFGDLSFLKMGQLLQSSQSEQNLFMACSPPPKPPRLNLDETEGSESPDYCVGHQYNTSQKRNKCSSMPLLDTEEVEEKREIVDGCQINNIAYSQTYSSDRGSTSSNKAGDSTKLHDKTIGKQREEDSGFSFSLDLGPSILDDVLQVMDKLHN